ncbi:MAG TPA: glycosyltransferase family 2 protein [Gemmataceae bacterium]|jgi:glycosyltransferase involved in cell wall biosynthesis|nr:glycosyltransferase family 2 protein [Gemmataceae bacterium]
MTGTPVIRPNSRVVSFRRAVATRTLSIVVPVKDERDNVERLYRRVMEVLRDEFAWEIVFVDDGSTDGTFEELAHLAAIDPRIKVIRLRRNFGQAAAMQAGIDAAIGELVATMDGDMQNDPADLQAMVAKLDEGFDMVLGERVDRKDNWLRTFPSRLANKLIRKVTGIPFRDFGCTIRVIRSDVARHMRIYGEMHRFIPVLATNLGAKTAQIPVRHHARTAGKSKYGIGRTGRVMLDLLTIKFMSGYLTRPMHFMGGLGLLFFFLAFVSLGTTVVMKATSNQWMTGNPLLYLSVGLGLVGTQMLSMGLLGEVMMRTYYESQDKRPYVVRESRNMNDEPLAV